MDPTQGRLRLCWLLLTCAVLGGRVPSAAAQVPPGFEDLLEPQLTVVDVYFGDRPVTSIPAVTTPEWLRFESPAELVSLIESVRPEFAERVTEALTGPLPVNAAYSCRPTPLPQCGQLSYIDAAIVFEASIFRVDVFIDNKFLEVQPINVQRFLPQPDNGFSDLLSVNGTLNGRDRDLSYGVNVRNYLSFDETHLFSSVTISDGEGGRVENLTAQRTTRRTRWQGGYFPLQELNVVAGFEVLGASVASTNQLRLDLLQVQGTDLIVYLPTRSRVTIFKDGQLVTAAFYEAGNQALDTRLLPLGAYFVTVEIEDTRGNVEQETRFFIKSTRLPPFDSPNFWVVAGTLVNDTTESFFPEASKTLTAGAGGETRFTPSLALGADILVSAEQVLGELGFIYQFDQLELVNDVLITGDGFLGQSLALVGQFEDFSAFLNWRGVRRFFGDRTQAESDPSLSVEDLLAGGVGKFVSRDSAQFNLRMTHRYKELQTSLFGSLSSNRGAPRRYSLGLELLYNLVRLDTFRIQLAGSVSRTQDRTLALVNLVFNDTERPWNVSGTIGQQYEQFSDWPSDVDPVTLAGTGRIAWDDGNILPEERLRASLTSDYRGDVASQRLDGEYEADFGRILGSAAYNSGFLSYSVSGSTTVLVGEDGFAFGGRDSSSSGVVVEAVTSVPDATFEVVVNQTVWGTITANRNVPIILPPFNRYQIELRPQSHPFINIDRSSRTIVLFPGNVAFLSFATKEVAIVIGNAVDEQGNPLNKARIETSEEITRTNDAGFFQITAVTNEPMRVTRDDDSKCIIEINDLEIEDGVAFPENGLVCVASSP